MKITILGCGTSTGVPVIGCRCPVCSSTHPKNNRLRASIFIETEGGNTLLVDTGPDLRQQALTYQLQKIDAVLLTHYHADHLHGLDELRSFNFIQKAPIPLFSNQETLNAVRVKFDYIFSSRPVIGGGIPSLELHEVKPLQAVELFKKSPHPLNVLPFEALHGYGKVLGFRFENAAYLTDTHEVPPESLKALQGLDLLILDCLRKSPPHHTHLTLDKSLQVIEAVTPKRVVLTHMTHNLEYESFKDELAQLSPKHLPGGVIEPAYDGMVIKI